VQRIRLVKIVGAGAALLLAAAVLMGAEEKPEAPKGPTAAEKFKNIKVLKDLPADQLLGLMQGVSHSLGVQCGFCHVMADFSSDAKPEKDTARAMIVMTQNLNKNEPVVDKKVTCYMCHRGHTMPARSEEDAKAMEKKPEAPKENNSKPGDSSKSGDSSK